jgi:hypothetical protein
MIHLLRKIKEISIKRQMFAPLQKLMCSQVPCSAAEKDKSQLPKIKRKTAIVDVLAQYSD